MNILLLAPQPFYQERGTPIAVRLLLQALSRRGDRVDLVAYHEGEDVALPGVMLHRIARLPGVRNIRPGFSLKKLACDFFLLRRAVELAKRKKYHLVHAVEEAAFIGLLLKRQYGIPYVYDMDSSMSQQMAEKSPFFRPLAPLMRRLEAAVIRGALAVVPVCDALAEIAARGGANKIWLLRDVSLLSAFRHYSCAPCDDLRLSGIRFMYIGNLELYQGMDLLLQSFAILRKQRHNATLAIVGGAPRDIVRCRARAEKLGIGGCVNFAGPRPTAMLAGLFRQADVLVSPRIRGINTPMKIYSYLESGKPVLATDLPTHTQALTSDMAMLAPPRAPLFAEAMRRLADNPGLRERLARRALERARECHSLPAFERSVGELFRWLEERILP